VLDDVSHGSLAARDVGRLRALELNPPDRLQPGIRQRRRRDVHVDISTDR
jgi:hypothetical protein